jgi:formylglycine-generating enzyme required for sulfatase activity
MRGLCTALGLVTVLAAMTVCACNPVLLSPGSPGSPTQAITGGPTSIKPPHASLGDTWTRPSDGAMMVYVPSGTFQMGSAVGDPYTEADEFPQHTVTLDGFWLDRTEVSVAQFHQFATETDYESEAEQEGWALTWTGTEWDEVEGADWQHPYGPNSGVQGDHPVVQISWDDATAYCTWAGAQLPTEAQWEYAARGSEGYLYPWGNEFDGTRLNFCDVNCPFDYRNPHYDDGYELTAPVGSYPAGDSWCGASDMGGNASEWTSDWYEEEYYSHSPSRNPTGPETGDYRVMRGGSWYFLKGWTRTAMRYYSDIPCVRLPYLGFRCVVPSTEQ